MYTRFTRKAVVAALVKYKNILTLRNAVIRKAFVCYVDPD